MIDSYLESEIRRWSKNDGSKETIRPLRRVLADICTELSTRSAPTLYNKMIGKYGRPAVAVATASTILTRNQRLDGWGVQWATDVVRACKFSFDPYDFQWNDGLHPTKIVEYIGPFIRATKAN